MNFGRFGTAWNGYEWETKAEADEMSSLPIILVCGLPFIRNTNRLCPHPLIGTSFRLLMKTATKTCSVISHYKI